MPSRTEDAAERLRNALESNRREIEDSIVEAEAELANCLKRCQELETLIARAKASLGGNGNGKGSASLPDLGDDGDRTTLHDLMVAILRRDGRSGLTAKELAEKVNESGLYKKRDGTRLEYNQIHARVHNYPHLFVKKDGRIFLKSE